MAAFRHHFQHLHTLYSLLKHPRARAEDLRRFQESKLRYLVRHAYRNVALYQEKFDEAGILPGDINGLNDLARLPFTSKPEIRAAEFGQQTAAGTSPHNVWTRYTAGSTGEPVHIYRRPNEDHLLDQFRIRASRQFGSRLNDSSTVVVPFHRSDKRLSKHLVRLTKAVLPGKSTALAAFRPPEAIAADLIRINPHMIWSLPGVLVELAGIWPRPFPGNQALRYLMTSGEPLTPNVKRTIEEGFGAPVYNAYLSHEFNLLAWECRETGLMHVCDDNVIFEVLHNGSPVGEGEEGETVVTGLHSHTAPFIRYKLGDVAVRGPVRCPCGAPFSTLKSVRGRTMDNLLLPDGSKPHHWDVIPADFWHMPWYQRYQLVQKSPGHIIIRVILNAEPPVADLEYIEQGILEKLGPDGRCDIVPVDEMIIAKSGKHRVCISELEQD